MAFTFCPLTPDRLPEWDAFVAANPHAWPGQDLAIIRFEELRGARPACHLATDTFGRLAVVIPLFFYDGRRAHGLMSWRALRTGSSLRGGPLLRADLSPGQRRQFWTEWAAWLVDFARREHVDELGVSMPNFLGDRPVHEIEPYFPLRDAGFRDAAGLTLVVDLAAASANLADDFSSSCRTDARHAIKEGAIFEPIVDRDLWLSFEELNRQTFAGEDMSPYSRASLEHLWDGFVARGLARVAGVRAGQDWLCVMAVVGTAFSRYAWIGFNRRPRPVHGAHNVLWHGVMQQARADGARYFEIGSMEFDDPRQRRIATFKRGFGGKPRPAMGGGLILSKAKQASIDMLGALASRLRRRRG